MDGGEDNCCFLTFLKSVSGPLGVQNGANAEANFEGPGPGDPANVVFSFCYFGFLCHAPSYPSSGNDDVHSEELRNAP